jgi:hypothetical protein
MRCFQAAERGDRPMKTAGGCLSKLQKRMRCWLDTDAKRTGGASSSSHQELVQILPNAKGNISHSLRLLEARGWLIIGRSPGGTRNMLCSPQKGVRRPRRFQEVMINA